MKSTILLALVFFTLTFSFAQKENYIRLYAELDNFSNDTISISQLAEKCVKLKYEAFSEKKLKKNKNNTITIREKDSFKLEDYSIKSIEIGSALCIGGNKNIKTEGNCLNSEQLRFFVPGYNTYITIWIQKKGKENLAEIFFYLNIK